MPTYEYRCDECEKLYDVMQRISAAPLRHCPVCGSTKINRCISLPAIITKSKTGAITPASTRTPGFAFDAIPTDFYHPTHSGGLVLYK